MDERRDGNLLVFFQEAVNGNQVKDFQQEGDGKKYQKNVTPLREQIILGGMKIKENSGRQDKENKEKK